MFDKILTMWFLFIIIVLVPLNYRALMALKFSNLFHRASTWQILSLIHICYFIIRLLLNASPRIRWFFALILLVVAVEALFNHNLLNLNLVWFALAFVLAVNATRCV